MLNKALILFCFFLGPSLALAQDAADDGTRTLGTIIQSEIGAQDDNTADNMIEAEDELPEDVVINPDFLNDEGRSYDSYNKVVIRILDKVTAETRTYDLNIDKTVAFGSLRIQPKACRKAPPIEEPESASFLQIWEKTPTANNEWIFSGWMFASSPSLSAMEHPVYDVWVIDCKD